MTRPRYLSDEDLRFPLVLATRRLEPTVEFPTAAEVGCAGFTDDQLLEFAATNGMIIISHDVNTMIAHASARLHANLKMGGLFLVPQRTHSISSIAQDLLLIWSVSEAEEW